MEPTINLPSELFQDCVRAFNDCDEFNSTESLRALFTPQELRPLQDSVPSTSTKKDRVTQTISLLVESNAADGSSALLTFLNLLIIRRDVNDGERLILARLKRQIETILWSGIPVEIPLVVVAMTKGQADELFASGGYPHFRDDEERKRFEALIADIESSGLARNVLPDRYGDNPSDWKPYVYPYDPAPKTVGVLAEEMAAAINAGRRAQADRAEMQLVNKSEQFFGSNQKIADDAWRELEAKGCVLLVDPLSLFHRKVHDALDRARLLARERVAVTVISPISFHRVPANEAIEMQVKSLYLGMERFNNPAGALCDFGTGDLGSLTRWLFAALRQIEGVLRWEMPNPAASAQFRRQGPSAPPIEQYIFGAKP